MKKLNRREFVQTGSGTALASSLAPAALAGAPAALSSKHGSKKFKIAIIGVGNRGRLFLKASLDRFNVDVPALCDFREEAAQRGAKMVQEKLGYKPDTYTGGPNDYIYTIIQPQGWEPLMKLVGLEELVEDPAFATPAARLSHLDECFAIIETWTKQRTKYEVMETLNAIDVPCGPILDMGELIEDESLAERQTIVEVEHPERGTFKTVGCPIKLSDSPVEVSRSPLLGEHTETILKTLVGFDDAEIDAARAEGAI